MYLKVIGDCHNHFNKPMSLPHKKVSTKQCDLYVSPMTNTGIRNCYFLLQLNESSHIKKKVHVGSVELAANEYFCNAFFPSLSQIHTNSGWQAHSRCC